MSTPGIQRCMVQCKSSARAYQAGVPTSVVPGVTSALAAAAAVHAELARAHPDHRVRRTEGRTPMPDGERLSDLAGSRECLALSLSATLTDKVRGADRRWATS